MKKRLEIIVVAFLLMSLSSCAAFSWLLYGSPDTDQSKTVAPPIPGGIALEAAVIPMEVVFENGNLYANALLNRKPVNSEHPHLYLFDSEGGAVIARASRPNASGNPEGTSATTEDDAPERDFEGGACRGIAISQATDDRKSTTRALRESCAWGLGVNPPLGKYALEIRDGDRGMSRYEFSLVHAIAAGATQAVQVDSEARVLHPYFVPEGLVCWLPADARYESHPVRLDIYHDGKHTDTVRKILAGPHLRQSGDPLVRAMPVLFEGVHADAKGNWQFAISVRRRVLGTWEHISDGSKGEDALLASWKLIMGKSGAVKGKPLDANLLKELRESLVADTDGGSERLRGRVCAVMLKPEAAKLIGRMEAMQRGSARWDTRQVGSSAKSSSREYRKLVRKLDAMARPYKKSGCWRALSKKIPHALP